MKGFACLQVSTDQVLPMLTHFGRHSSITVARKIYQKTVTSRSQLIIIYMLSTPGRFADKSETGSTDQGVDRARFARIGTPGKGNFHSIGRRQIHQPVNSGIECSRAEKQTCIIKEPLNKPCQRTLPARHGFAGWDARRGSKRCERAIGDSATTCVARLVIIPILPATCHAGIYSEIL